LHAILLDCIGSVCFVRLSGEGRSIARINTAYRLMAGPLMSAEPAEPSESLLRIPPITIASGNGE
jgi:hypothetical protein